MYVDTCFGYPKNVGFSYSFFFSWITLIMITFQGYQPFYILNAVFKRSCQCSSIEFLLILNKFYKTWMKCIYISVWNRHSTGRSSCTCMINASITGLYLRKLLCLRLKTVVRKMLSLPNSSWTCVVLVITLRCSNSDFSNLSNARVIIL